MNNFTIRKAVFPVAGIGTRFLPATKANPKEMLPIVDKPLIQYAVEEAIAAGVTQLIFITSSNKRAIEDHFDANFELGLLYLRDFLEDPNNESKKLIAQEYLLKANEINPNAVNALKSLAVFYNRTGDLVQLERVNSKLNQISLY